MADYVLPQNLRDTFAAFYVTKDQVPFILDVKCIIYPIFQKRKRTSYLHEALCQLCMTLMDERDKLCSFSAISYASPVFAEDGARNHNDCLQFFETLCEELLKYKDDHGAVIIEHLKEVAKFVVIFNDVHVMRINVVHYLFEALFEYLISYSQNELSDTRFCPCDTFRRSGDCHCPIEDIAQNDLNSDDDNVFCK